MNHWCKPPAEHANLPSETGKDASLPSEAGGRIPSQCYRHELTMLFLDPMDTDNRTVVTGDAIWEREFIAGETTETSGHHGAADSIADDWDHDSLVPALAVVMSCGAPTHNRRRPMRCIRLLVLGVTGGAPAFSRSVFLSAAFRFVLSATAPSVLVSVPLPWLELADYCHWAL